MRSALLYLKDLQGKEPDAQGKAAALSTVVLVVCTGEAAAMQTAGVLHESEQLR